MQVTCRSWNVSVHVADELDKGFLNGAANEAAEQTRLQVPYHNGQLAALHKGQPLDRKHVNVEEETMQEAAQRDVAAGRQGLVVGLGKKVAAGKGGGAAAARTRKAQDAAEAEELERLARDRALADSEKAEDAAFTSAVAKGRPPKKRKTAAPKQAAEKEPPREGSGSGSLGFLEEGGDDSQ